MNITERTEGDVTVYKIDGRADTQGAVDLDMTLQAAAAEGKHKMVLDLAELKYISSSGLRTLADILTQNKEAGGDLKLSALNRKILRVLQIVGFDKFFAIYDTPEQAIADFK